MLLPHVDEYHFCTGIDARALTKDVVQSAMTSVEMSLVPDILDATVESLRRLTRAKFASAKEEYLSYKRNVALDEQYALMKMAQLASRSSGGQSNAIPSKYKPPPPPKPLVSNTVRDINALLAAAPSEVECREVLKWLWETEIKRSNTGHRTSTIVKLAEGSYLTRNAEESVQLTGSIAMLAMSGRIAAGQSIFDDKINDDLGNSIRDHARRRSSQNQQGDPHNNLPFILPAVLGAFTDALSEVREEESKGAATLLSAESSGISKTATNLRRCRQCSGVTELFCFTHCNRIRKVQSTDAATGEPLYTVIHRHSSKQPQSSGGSNTFLTSTIQGQTLLAEMAEAEEASTRDSIGGILPGGRSIFPLVIPRMLAVQDEYHFCLDCIPEYLAEYVSEALTTSAKVKVDAIADLKKKELIRRAREDARKRAEANYASSTTKLGNSSFGGVGSAPPGLPQFSVNMDGNNSLFFDDNDISARSGGGGPALIVSSPMPDVGGGSLSLQSGRVTDEGADTFGEGGGHIPTLTITADRSMSTFAPETSASSLPSSTSVVVVDAIKNLKHSPPVTQSARALSRSGSAVGGSSPLRTGPDGRLSVVTSSMGARDSGRDRSASSHPQDGPSRTTASITAAMYTSDIKMEEAVRAVKAMSDVMAKHVSPLSNNTSRRHIDGVHTSGAIPLIQLKHVVDDRYAADLTLEDLAMVATKVNTVSQVSQSIRQEAIQMAEADNRNYLHQNSGNSSGTATRTTSDFQTRKSPKGASSGRNKKINADSPQASTGGDGTSSASCSNSEGLGGSVGRSGSTSLPSTSMLNKNTNTPLSGEGNPSYTSQAERFYGKEPGSPPSSTSLSHAHTSGAKDGGISATLNMMEMVRERQRIVAPQERLILRESEYRSDVVMDERGAFLQIRMKHTAAIEAELGRIRAVVLEEHHRAEMAAAALRQLCKRKAKQALAAGSASSMSNSLSLAKDSLVAHGHNKHHHKSPANTPQTPPGVVSGSVSDRHKPKVMSALASSPISMDDNHLEDQSTSYLDHLAGFSSVSSSKRLFQINRPGEAGGGVGDEEHSRRGNSQTLKLQQQSESLAGIPSPAAVASLLMSCL
jgi:hypothetical protein